MNEKELNNFDFFLSHVQNEFLHIDIMTITALMTDTQKLNHLLSYAEQIKDKCKTCFAAYLFCNVHLNDIDEKEVKQFETIVNQSKRQLTYALKKLNEIEINKLSMNDIMQLSEITRNAAQFLFDKCK